jgi:hypothetical protein
VSDAELDRGGDKGESAGNDANVEHDQPSDSGVERVFDLGAHSDLVEHPQKRPKLSKVGSEHGSASKEPLDPDNAEGSQAMSIPARVVRLEELRQQRLGASSYAKGRATKAYNLEFKSLVKLGIVGKGSKDSPKAGWEHVPEGFPIPTTLESGS